MYLPKQKQKELEYMNLYPNNPWCTRPKDSPMREFCRCSECLKWAEHIASMPGKPCTDTPNKLRNK